MVTVHGDLECRQKNMQKYGEQKIKKSHPWTTNPGIPSRERSHIPPGEQENHRLKGCWLVGDMLVPWRVSWRFWLLIRVGFPWLPNMELCKHSGPPQSMETSRSTVVERDGFGSCGFQLIQCCSDLSNNWWPFWILGIVRNIKILLLFFMCENLGFAYNIFSQIVVPW